MVKPDSSKDYYRDLGIPKTSDTAAIKLAYRKLAMQYHPDRNPGREEEVKSQFQTISEAHEILKDASTRQKYDSDRAMLSSAQRSRYQSGGNQRGNPWADVAAQYPPPPKAPTGRPRAAGPPPPSAGAQRYGKFETPRQSANAAAQEGPNARRDTYAAWENMRNTGRPAPQQNQPPPPPRARPGFDAGGFASGDIPRRTQSTNAPNRKGFVPNTPGGDESPAPRGAYSTGRKPTQAPTPPPRPSAPGPSHSDIPNVPVDPLRQFRQQTETTFEPRVSTPYASHGGEKFDPFGGIAREHLDPDDTTNDMNRSRSTREPRDRPDVAFQFPRAGSDSNLKTPHSGQSTGQRQPGTAKYKAPLGLSDTSSSDESPERSTRRSFATAKGARKSSSQQPNSFGSVPSAGKGVPNGTNVQPTNGASAGSTGPEVNGEPSVYEPSHIPSAYAYYRNIGYGAKLPKVSEHILPLKSDHDIAFSSSFSKVNAPRNGASPFGSLTSSFAGEDVWEHPIALKPPSGRHNLYPTEEFQRTMIDNMINNRYKAGAKSSLDTSSPCGEGTSCPPPRSEPSKKSDAWTSYRDPATDGSPSKKQRFDSQRSNSTYPSVSAHETANIDGSARFTMPIHANTFHSSGSVSSENINMKFSSDDWHGKFEGAGGASFFQPEQKATNMNTNPHARGRTQSSSGTRSRGRSPMKARPADPHFTNYPPTGFEPSVESPGGTKFSQEEWAKTFKDPIFVAPPAPSVNVPPRPRQKSRIQRKPTSGFDSDGEGFFSPPDPPTTNAPAVSPDAMDVDTPPVMKPTITVPRVAPSNVNSSPKRAAPASPASAAELKVEFEDLHVKDLISSMALPTPPPAPILPSSSMAIEPYHEYLAQFSSYMHKWDVFDTTMLMHWVARRRFNQEILGEKRWTDDKGFDQYRNGLREDQVVMAHWDKAKQVHAKLVKDCAVVKEKMREFSGEERPRKKMS